MKINYRHTIAFRKSLVLFLLTLAISTISQAQDKISQYVLFSGAGGAGTTAPLTPGYGVQMGSSSSVTNGFIGSHNLVKSTGNMTIGASIYSRDSVVLANSNVVSGKIAAGVSGTIITAGNLLTVGSSTKISGSINVNGNILIGGGTVSDSVIHPLGTIYSGPLPGKGEFKRTPTLPGLPGLPTPKDLTVYPSVVNNITTTQTITKTQVINGDSCGIYGNITFSGNQTLTLKGPGIYVFNSIKNTGTTNYFVFDFNNDPVKTFRVFVRSDVDLGKASASFKNGGDASRVYFEVQGKGTTSADGKTAFNIANGSSSSATKWFGTVYAPYAAIIGGSGTGSSSMTGALWSGTQVNLLSGVSITYTAYVQECILTGANAGPDQTICSTTATMAGSTPPGGATGKWTLVSGAGTITTPGSPTSGITGLGVGANTFRWTISSTGCVSSSDDVVINVNAAPTTADAGPDQTGSATCGLTSVTLAGNAPTVGTGSWSIVTGLSASGGTIANPSSPASTFTGTTGSTYVLRWTITNGVCTPSTDDVTITFNVKPAGVDAGPDKPLNFDGITILTGTSTTSSVTFKWTAPLGGVITTPDNQATINVAAPGVYKLAATAGGCTSIDSVKVTNKVIGLIGSELTSIYWNNPTGLPSPFFIITDGYVRIDIIVQVNNYDYVLALLQQTAPTYPVDYGLKNIVTNGINGADGSKLIITGDFPILNLLKLNDLGQYINYCRPFYAPFTNSGLVNSAGDTTMRSYLVRSGYRINGDGIKVGVISNSYATITSATTATLPLQPITNPTNPIPQTFTTQTAGQDVGQDDLPGDTTIGGTHYVNSLFNKNVHVLQDYPIRSTDEGRAMLQIIHDVAPGAELYFRTGFLTAGDFARGIGELTAAGCKVIVDDVTYITEPYLKDGRVAKTVDSVKRLGVTYLSAAGNFANKSYEHDFIPVDASPIGFVGKTAHDFSGTGDIFQHIKLPPGNYTIVLQWVDDIYSAGSLAGTRFDLDWYWTPRTDGAGLRGWNRDNRFGDPLEIQPFSISDTTDANFLIINNNPGTTGTAADNPARIKYIIYRGDVQILEYPAGTSTLVGQANAAGAIAVGAARFDKAPPYLAPPLIESFSSIGGTQVEGSVRNKPDLVAPDGGNTTVKLGQDYPNNALDGYSNFFGTSAAAPHAAAVAALIMQGKKKFLNQDPSLSTPDDMKSLLQLTAVDMYTSNNLFGTKFDYISGYGLVNADSAMRTFAAPTATLIDVVVPPGTIPCSGVPFTIIITGENFSRNTVVYLINGPGDSTIITPTYINSDSVSVTINSCIGNPEIKAYTPPKAGTNGTDGGFSNSKYFFSAYVTVDAVSINKRYGETLPALDTIVRVNGKLLQDTTLTLSDIGLDTMRITTAATSSSDVGTYAINISRIFDPNNPTDAALLKSYNYKFTNGIVTIAKMPLRVTPENKSITYGQNIGKVTFKYDFDKTNVSNPDSVVTIIKAFHDAFLPKNALAVVKEFKKQQSNGSVLDTTSLRNMNMIASFNAVKNSRKFTLLNNALVPVTDPAVLQDNLNVQYLVDLASQSIFDYKSDPTTAKFYPGYPGINPKALLSASSIESDDYTKGTVTVNSSLKILNGLLSQTISSSDGPIVPMVNGLLIQMVDAIEDGTNDTVQYLSDGSWIKLSNTAQKILNSSLKILNTSVKIVNGIASVQLADGTYAPIEVLANSTPLKVVNGTVLKIVNGIEVPIPDGSFVQLQDGGLVQVQNATFTVVTNTAVKVVNTAVKVVNSSLKVVNSSLKVVNSSALGTDAPNNNTAVILDSEDGIDDGTGSSGLGAMYGINMITGLDAGKQYLVPGTLIDPNFDISYGLGEVTIAPATITVTANNQSRLYGDNNPPLTYTYSGFVNSEDSVTSGIKGINGTGLPSVTTTATQTSPVGTYDIVVTQGSLVSVNNYNFSFVNGTLAIASNPCLVTPNTATNFGSTANPNTPTSLWLNLTTKVSGQLVANGDYLLFKAGTATFSNITSTPAVTNFPIPNGKIVADNSVSAPVTKYDASSNTWITKVPLGFASTSDIFVTGAIINSSTGFKKGNSPSTSVTGIFYSDVYFKDQWTYGTAAYQLPKPTYYFTYANVDGNGNAGVVPINGTYRAGTPLPEIAYLVQGGSGGGGNNYTGSSANFNNYTACLQSPTYVSRGVTRSSSTQQLVRQDVASRGEMQVYPNPASGNITLVYVPKQTGTSKITILSVDGKRMMETYNGVWEAGKQYVRRIDVSGLTRGIYMIQVTEKNAITNKKIIIGR